VSPNTMKMQQNIITPSPRQIFSLSSE